MLLILCGKQARALLWQAGKGMIVASKQARALLWQASKGTSVAREHGQTMLGILGKGITCTGRICKGITRKAHQCTRELAIAWGRALSSSRLNSLLLPTCLPATTILVDTFVSIS